MQAAKLKNLQRVSIYFNLFILLIWSCKPQIKKTWKVFQFIYFVNLVMQATKSKTCNPFQFIFLYFVNLVMQAAESKTSNPFQFIFLYFVNLVMQAAESKNVHLLSIYLIYLSMRKAKSKRLNQKS
jgi:hypothetical protein